MSHSHPRNSPRLLLALCLLMCAFTGCGDDPEPQSTNANPPVEPEKMQTEGGKSNAQVTTDSQGRKTIDGIPYDVFFDDPLAVAQQQGTITPTAPTQPPTVANNDDTPPETPEPEPKPAEPKAAQVAWEELIPMEELDNEIKSIRNFLTPTLQTVGAYNREYKKIPMQGNTMAALAQIALNHPGEALWKDQAAALRDISYNLANSADAPGRAGYDAASLQFENLLQIFNGSEPTLEEEPDPNLDFSEKADRGPLMRRMEEAFNWLSSNTPTPSAFVDVKEKAKHETIVLGALTKVTGDKSYLFADEPDYQGHVKDMMAAITQMRKAIDDEDHDSFREGVSTLTKKCAECHTDYR
ncbi:MAG: cytochrome c [Planctomycetaceae bacterium]|nr:cytochrome c [Planctomycetaceae bacterium]